MFEDVVIKVVLVLTYALVVITIALIVFAIVFGVEVSYTHGCTPILVGKVVNLICH